MGLFKPAWKSNNLKKALAAVQKEQNKEKIIQIAYDASLPDVRVAAMKNHYAMNRTILENIAKHDENEKVRAVAMEILNSPRYHVSDVEKKRHERIEIHRKAPEVSKYTIEQYAKDIMDIMTRASSLSIKQDGSADFTVNKDYYPQLISVGQRAYHDGGLPCMKAVEKCVAEIFHGHYESGSLYTIWDSIEDWKRYK